MINHHCLLLDLEKGQVECLIRTLSKSSGIFGKCLAAQLHCFPRSAPPNVFGSASDQEEASTKLSKCCGLLAQELLATNVPFIATTGHKHRESTAELSALACDGAPVQQPQRFNSVLELFSSPIAMTVSPTKSFVSLA